METHNRQSARLKDYDYAQEGMYYVTICTNDRECLFGKITNGEMVLNDAGKMIDNNWDQLPQQFQNIELDKFVTMPNHLHGIIRIVNNWAAIKAAPTSRVQNDGTGNKTDNWTTIKAAHTLGDVIGAFKSITTNEYIRNVKNNKWRPFNKRMWQRNYYDHIIRDDESLNKIREYIINNPACWTNDEYHM